jgi:hypothetical protein
MLVGWGRRACWFAAEVRVRRMGRGARVMVMVVSFMIVFRDG